MGVRVVRLLTFVLLAVLASLQYRLWVGDGSLAEVWRLKRDIETQQGKNAKLRERNTQLHAEVLDLKQGLEAVEERARRELGMIRKDEVFYQVVDE